MEEKKKEEKVEKNGVDSAVENNSVEEKKQEQATIEQLLARIKELEAVQKNQALIIQCLYEKQGNRLIANKVNEMKDTIMEQAQIYGQKMEKIQETYNLNKEEKGNILQEYQASLDEIEGQYENRVRLILEEKADFQDKEQATMLKEHELKQNRKQIKKSPQYVEQRKQEERLVRQIKKALAKGDLDLVTEKNEELRGLRNKNPLIQCDKEIERVQRQRHYIQQLIERCGKELEDCKTERYASIEEATEDKENKLMIMKKQNIFQKMAGAFMNKISGAKRFKENVMKKVSEKIGFIKNEKVPEVKQNTATNIINFQERMKQNKEKALGRNFEPKEPLMQRAETRVRTSREMNTQNREQELDVAMEM